MGNFPQYVRDGATEVFHKTDAIMTDGLRNILSHGTTDRTSALYTAIMSAAPAVTFISRLIAQAKEGEDNTSKVCDKELTLIAGLILGRTCLLSPEDVGVEFHPRNILAAIEAAGQIAGYDVKPLIDHRMLENYRKGCEEDSKTDLGYWDHMPDAAPNFDEFANQLTNVTNFSRYKH